MALSGLLDITVKEKGYDPGLDRKGAVFEHRWTTTELRISSLIGSPREWRQGTISLALDGCWFHGGHDNAGPFRLLSGGTGANGDTLENLSATGTALAAIV